MFLRWIRLPLISQEAEGSDQFRAQVLRNNDFVCIDRDRLTVTQGISMGDELPAGCQGAFRDLRIGHVPHRELPIIWKELKLSQPVQRVENIVF